MNHQNDICKKVAGGQKGLHGVHIACSLDKQRKNNSGGCVEWWDQDAWNSRLWDRVTDVNADRSNQMFSRPYAGTVQGCQFQSGRLAARVLDTCNLPNYQTENQLRSMYLINNRDVLDYELKTKCHDLCNRESELVQTPIEYDWSRHPISLRQRTREMYKTQDIRTIFGGT